MITLILWLVGGALFLGVSFSAWVGLGFLLREITSFGSLDVGREPVAFAIKSAIPLVVSGGLWYCVLRIPSRSRESRVVGKPLQVVRDCDGRRLLVRDLTVNVKGTVIERVTDKEKIVIREGFKTDYSSIPTMFQWIVHWSKVDLAGVVHDWLYREGRKALGEKYTRRQADTMWRMMSLSGERRASWMQSVVCWLAIRFFARRYWTHPRTFKTSP